MKFIPALFDDKLTDDNREPFLTGLSLPGIDGSLDIYTPKALFWLQLFHVRSCRG